MKKIVFVVLFACGIMQGQVGEVKEMSSLELIGQSGDTRINKMERGETDLYSLSYLNAKYRHTRDLQILSFLGNEQDLERLYQFLKDQLDNEEFKRLEIGKGVISASKSNKRLLVHVSQKNKREGYFFLNKKELDKLFGKA
jgi:hypothetical protein